MAEQSEISWCDATWNHWIGCTKVSRACDFCYAEREDERRGWTADGFGPGKPRHKTKTMRHPYMWDKNHAAFFTEHNRRRRVFAFSLSDFFDNEVVPAWRTEAWEVVRDCRRMDWLIVTKRIGNVDWMLPVDWSRERYEQVVLIITVCDQKEADRDIPKLLKLKADYPWVRIGLSIEPMLGPVVLEVPWLEKLAWVIAGGESGPNARPSDAKWFKALRDNCKVAGVPFHFKQWGEWITLGAQYPARMHCVTGAPIIQTDGETYHGETVAIWPDKSYAVRVGVQKAGRLLEGREHNDFARAA
jgi:protein gp37